MQKTENKLSGKKYVAKKSLIDSGPIVALFDKDDSFHSQAIGAIKAYQGELLSTLAVVTEVCYLLDFSVSVQSDFLNWIRLGGIQLVEFTIQDLTRAVELINKYSDRPMDFADSSLVAIAERLNIETIFTVDSDFDVYRLNKNKPFTNLFFK